MRAGQSFNRHLTRKHRSTVRSLGYTLTLGPGDFPAWANLSAVFACRLTEQERAAMSWAVLGSLPDDTAARVIEKTFPGAGMPVPLMGSIVEQAAFWADRAEPNEREAYCLATFSVMPPARQVAFLEFVQGRLAA
ncbi:hypothetical protein G5B39_10490 [Rhodobacteraceae bacterium SC52]|nr:hypothetical protein G5B39_10490 [Rhodobacteraceae bacterium SC52]